MITMYILPINQTQFKGNNRTVYDAVRNRTFKTTTYFFREDINWEDFIRFINIKYKNIPKVNIINHACSNGQEPCSIVMKLLSELGERAEKFFPVIAKDYDKDNIESAEYGKCGISDSDIYKINYLTKGKFHEYLRTAPTENPIYDLAVIPKDNIKSRIKYAQGDIFEDIKTMPGKNTILLCRNFWPYFQPEHRELLAQKLSEKLDSSCLLVTGDFDENTGTNELLQRYGFEPTGIKFVHQKCNKFTQHFHYVISSVFS